MLSIYFLTTILFGVVCATVARAKGRSFLTWLVIGLVIGPFGLIVGLLPRRARAGRLEPCPACAEPIAYEARICRHCGSHLEWLED